MWLFFSSLKKQPYIFTLYSEIDGFGLSYYIVLTDKENVHNYWTNVMDKRKSSNNK